MTKKKAIYFLGLIIIIAIYFSIAVFFGDKRNKQEFSKFDNTEINAALKDILIKRHGVGFHIGGYNEAFIFYPHTGVSNYNTTFSQIAKSGDRVIKESNSDTLKLISNNKVYKYTFRHFNNK